MSKFFSKWKVDQFFYYDAEERWLRYSDRDPMLFASDNHYDEWCSQYLGKLVPSEIKTILNIHDQQISVKELARVFQSSNPLDPVTYINRCIEQSLHVRLPNFDIPEGIHSVVNAYKPGTCGDIIHDILKAEFPDIKNEPQLGMAVLKCSIDDIHPIKLAANRINNTMVKYTLPWVGRRAGKTFGRKSRSAKWDQLKEVGDTVFFDMDNVGKHFRQLAAQNSNTRGFKVKVHANKEHNCYEVTRIT